jgi:hypothetical protein
MITHKVGESKSTYIRVTADRITVASILEFANALREAQIPLTEQVTDSHNFSTRHLDGLWVRYSENLAQVS